MLLKQWSFGDKVVHLDRPEWGVGIINSATADSHEGKPCQRVTVRFDRAGVKTLSTGIANLVPAEDAPKLHAAEHDNAHNDSILGPSQQAAAKEVMLKLPDVATDPFTTPLARLKATLALFRYSEHGGSLIDWAAAQSGLKDPMTRFNRHELEDLYRRFVVNRDEHLKKVVLELKKVDPFALNALMKQAPRSAQNVLKRFDALR